MITIKQMQKIKALNQQGLNDVQIAEEIGCAHTTVRYWRLKMQLSPNYTRRCCTSPTQLEQIKELNAQGLSDREVGERLGCSGSVVSYWRMKLQLPARGKPGRKIGGKAKRYTVYDKHTSEYICEGTAREISEYIGIAIGTIYADVTMTRKGQPRTRYEIVEVEGDE